MGACLLVRRERHRRGRAVRRALLPLQRGGRLVLPRRADRGWSVVFTPGPSASTWAARRTADGCSARTSAGTSGTCRCTDGPGRPSAPAGCCRARCSLRGRALQRSAGAHVPRGRRLARLGRRRLAARCDPMSSASCSFCSSSSASGVVLAPGALVARALGVRGAVRDARLVAGARLRRARRHVPRARRR